MGEAKNSTTKICGKCSLVKQISDFNKNKNRKDGLAWDCKACNRSRCKEHFDANPDKYNEANRENYRLNTEKYVARATKWALQNPEKRREASKNYVKRNPEKRYVTQTKNRVQNPGLYAAHYKARQQRKRKAMPVWASEENIKAIYRQCAFVSSMTGIKHHVDHFYPLKSDLVCGLHNEYNLRIIPAAANLSKGNSFPTEDL